MGLTTENCAERHNNLLKLHLPPPLTIGGSSNVFRFCSTLWIDDHLQCRLPSKEKSFQLEQTIAKYVGRPMHGGNMMTLSSSQKVLRKVMLHLTNKNTAFYLSCPSSLLIQLQVLFSQSCIFTLYLLQLDLLSRNSRCYHSKVLRLTPPPFSAWLHCSCWLMVQDAGRILLEQWKVTVCSTAQADTSPISDGLVSCFSYLYSLKPQNKKDISLSTSV